MTSETPSPHPYNEVMDLLIDGRRALLEGLIDYAGLFPPASLDLESAVEEFRVARSGAHAWVVGRFLCPTSHIEDLAGLLTATMREGEAPWAVGAIFDEAPATAALHASVFDKHMDPAARVTAVELRTPPEAADGRNPDEAVAVLAPFVAAAFSVSPETVPFLEVARTASWERGVPNAVAALAELRRTTLRPLGAKLRTGGLSPELFPAPAQVARFIVACRRQGLPFKATAGLHHPVRHEDPALGVMRHGFLNIIVAAALSVEGADEEELIEVLEDTDTSAFQAGAAGLRWRDRRFSSGTLRTVRHDAFPAYGSCSLAEPVADLTVMGMLEGGDS